MSLPQSLQGLGPHLVSARQLEHREEPRRLSTGCAAVDQILEGGWARGRISLLWAERSQGRTSLLCAALAAAQARGESVALVDTHGMLDPHTAMRQGVNLKQLLWIRSPSGRVLAATEVVLGAAGLGLVALDFGEQPPRCPVASWSRLKKAAAAHSTALIVASPRPMPLSGAADAVALTLKGRPIFRGGRASPHRGAPLFLGLATSITIARGYKGSLPPPQVLTLSHRPT